ncbi:hypothetical protein BJF79_27495 [Actinomadura sp. CNU-125]|nr:hypothetical protein BJF79_27495 [Actinomadura sp. CNU-125]
MLAGRYRRLDRIGRGGMGSVWRAHDADLDREVAVKEIHVPEQVAEDERAVWFARMEREARAAARLRHPGIVTVHDRVVGEDGRPWIVMELVQGRSLDRVLADEGVLPARRVAAIGLAMLDALSAAHAQGIVHRDVKPANVLLEDERVLLTDFGIAAVEGDATLTRSGAVLGTPAYMSPEQVEGRSVTPASDLWSLGATLYAAVEGRPPFTAPTHGGLFVAIATREPDPPQCGGPLAEAMRGLLTKDPADRPSVARIRALLDAAAVADDAPAPTVRMPRSGGVRSSAPTRRMAPAGTVPGPAVRVSAPVDYAAAVRGALACTWGTVAVTLYLSWFGYEVFVLDVVPRWIPVAVGLLIVLSGALWNWTNRPVLALAAVAAINVGLTASVLAAEDWGDDVVHIVPASAFGWVGGGVALMFAFAGANRWLAARRPDIGSRRAVFGLIVILEGVAMIAWPWFLFTALGTEIHPSHDDAAAAIFGGSLAVVFLAWIVSQRESGAHPDA